MAGLEQAGRNKDNAIAALEEELRQDKEAKLDKPEAGTQTLLGAAYFDKKPGVGSSRGSGSLASQRGQPGGGRGGGGSGERRGPGGGRGAGKPPAGDARKGSRVDDS